ncbi:PAS domain S-box protein [Rhodoferax sp. BAB1]|uniref:sensor histidine kinase n=1 Tax=Rhodoferax sp. BAB1 TaxID=2741720 RepID=UPI001576FA50|nr:PAS domain S-box protein [Rhodoferax sp. BAB1]QKO21708.1 PAS domain S-box protein [Rhodoferax sp. BAB1]
MRIFPRLQRFLGPPYSLRFVLLLALTTLALAVGVTNGALSYQRIGRDTLANAQQQANSLARLVASTNTEAMILNDIGAMESSLLQVVRLPGVDVIAIVRADGRRLTHVERAGDDVRSSVGGRVEIPGPSADGTLPPRILDTHYQAWAAIGLPQRTPLGWVRVDYSLSQRQLEQDRLWQRSLYTLLITGTAIVTLLPLILNWALRPLEQLSDIARSLSSQIGRQVVTESNSVEARTLAQALTKASHDVASEVARTQVIVNTAAVAIISLDSRGHVLSANPATTSIFGQEEQDLLGRPLEQCIPGLSETILRELFGELEQSASRVYRIVRHDFFGVRLGGTLFPIEITLGQAPPGGALHYVCIVRDITDERAALETSELYERALASSHNGVFITNAALNSQPIIFVNEAFQRITDLAAHQVLGRDMDFLRNDNREEAGLRELQRAVAEARSTSVTVDYQLPSDRHITAEVSLSPVRAGDGRLTNFIGIVSDVTSRVQAEAVIAERRAQLDAIFSLSPDGFVMFDARGQLIFANPAFERMTGRSWVRPEDPPGLAEFEHGLAAMCHTQHPLPALPTGDGGDDAWQARLVLARPQHRVVQAQGRRNAAGRGETILYFRDVTHEDEVDRMKSEFLTTAAHELRTPMVSIFGFTELLLHRKVSEERRRDMLETIHRQTSLLIHMVNELLDLARIEARQGKDIKLASCRIGDLVNSAIQPLSAGTRGADFHADLTEEDAEILVDRDKTQQALLNVLSNALKYSPAGGDISITTHRGEEKDRHLVGVRITDKGIGMTPDQKERIFERFYRADPSGNIPGTGLGMSLVREIVQLHGGHVEVQSEFGCGTSVTLWWPLKRDGG